MLAISSGLQTFLILAAATVIATVIIGFGRAVVGYVKLKQTKAREDEFDQRTLSEFFFDTDRDPRTGTPAKEGWTTKVDRTLQQLAAGQATLAAAQAETAKAVHEILYEVKPNGGGNLRGGVDRIEQAATTEVARVRRNEDDAHG